MHVSQDNFISETNREMAFIKLDTEIVDYFENRICEIVAERYKWRTYEMIEFISHCQSNTGYIQTRN